MKIGKIYNITLKGKYFCKTKVTNVILKNISEIEIDLLKKDVEYESLVINNHNDFIKIINSFRPSYYPQAELNSSMTIIYLKKLTKEANLLNFWFLKQV